jgi:hypothetical protein
MVEDRIERSGWDTINTRYGLAQDNQQLFALFTIDVGDDDSSLGIGLRQSYNKTLAIGTVAGANVFICDNLMFTGDALHVVRKNTTNVYYDFRELLKVAFAGAFDAYKQVTADAERWKQHEVTQREGYRLLGDMLGTHKLTSTQANVAFHDWDHARYDAFESRDLNSLYQCVTEGLKSGAPGNLMERHVTAHEYFQGVHTYGLELS